MKLYDIKMPDGRIKKVDGNTYAKIRSAQQAEESKLKAGIAQFQEKVNEICARPVQSSFRGTTIKTQVKRTSDGGVSLVVDPRTVELWDDRFKDIPKDLIATVEMMILRTMQVVNQLIHENSKQIGEEANPILYKVLPGMEEMNKTGENITPEDTEAQFSETVENVSKEPSETNTLTVTEENKSEEKVA